MKTIQKSCFLSVLLFLVSCAENPYPGYTELGPKGVYFKVLSFEDSGLNPTQGDMLRLRVSEVQNDTVTWSADGVQVLQYVGGGSGLKSELYRFKAGDSLSFILDDEAFLNEFGVRTPDFDRQVDLRIKILDVLTETAWLQAKALDHSVKLQREEGQIRDYLQTRSDSSDFKLKAGAWYRSIKSDSLGRFRTGEELFVQYTASLLDGTIIDERQTVNEALSYSLGMQGQLIPGLVTAIRGMDRSEKLELILPSSLAFGEEGSAGNIVPPWTPLRYVLWVDTIAQQAL